jgi:type II restriction enzyme
MLVNYKQLQQIINGSSIPRPISGTLSGHAAGEPFDKHVYSAIKAQLPQNTFRQYEYLNDLYSKNAEIIGVKARQELFDSPSILFLLSRGKDATKNWSSESPFEEKQDDTADIIVVKDGFYEIIDIKTRNLAKSAQAPNIISSYKLAQLCAIMIENKEFNKLSINYFEVDWLLENDLLVCKDTHFINLFKTDPKELYINWEAAMQIQFHVCNLSQNFNEPIEHWAISYLKHFVAQVYRRADYMIEKYAKPFEKYL